MHHASASKTDQLLYCQYWASPAITIPKEETGEAAVFGHAFHKCCELHLNNTIFDVKEIALKYKVDAKRLDNFNKRWVDVITNFLDKRGWSHRNKIIEKKLAIDVYQNKTRYLETEKERDYSGCKRTEIPGTADLVLEPEYNTPFVVIDWKSGQSIYDADKNGQLKTLALGFSRIFKSYEAIVMIMRIDEEFIELSEGFVTARQLLAHQKLLQNRLALALSSSPPMRIGQFCRYCAAIEVCPAHQAPLSLADVEMMEPEQVAQMYHRIIGAESLLQKKRERMKQYIKSNGPVELDNGKFLQVIKYEEDNLSKASIIRNLGKVDGEELILKLRSQGVIETTKSERCQPMLSPSAKK